MHNIAARLRRAIVLAAVLCIGVSLASPAQAATNWLDTHITVSSITRNSDGTMTVSYKTISSIDSIVPVTFDLKFPAEYRQSYSQSIRPSGSVGSHTLKFKKPPAIFGKIEIHLRLNIQYPEDKTWYRLNTPGTYTYTHTVSSSEVTTQWFWEAAIGLAVGYATGGGSVVLKAVQGTVYALGYSAALDWTDSVGLQCPGHLKTGQVIKTTTTYTSGSGTQVKLSQTVKMWPNTTYYKNGQPAACTSTTSFTYG